MARLLPPDVVAPVRTEDLERGLEYLQGCLDLAKRRSSDLGRDFDYIKRKLVLAHRSNIDRDLRITVDQAVRSCQAWVEEANYERAGAALDVALTTLRGAAPRNTLSPFIQRRP